MALTNKNKTLNARKIEILFIFVHFISSTRGQAKNTNCKAKLDSCI